MLRILLWVCSINPLFIRPARPDDLSALLAIEQNAFSDPWTQEQLAEDSCLVAVRNEDLAGFLVWRDNFNGGDGPRETDILNVAVHPAHRRTGVAKALLQQLLRQPGTYTLEVRESNEAAIHLYQTLDFAEIGRRKNYYQRPIECALVMQLKRC